MRAIIVSSHELEDVLTRMLKGNIKIGQHLLKLRETLKMLKSERIWVEIIYSKPKIIRECIDRFEEWHEE